MSERSIAKSKRAGEAKSERKSVISADVARLEAELAQAKKRIADLEKCHADIVNRIEWVIDSLHNLPYGK